MVYAENAQNRPDEHTTSKNEVRYLFCSAGNRKDYERKYSVGVDQSCQLTAKLYPEGFAAFSKNRFSFDPGWMIDSGRSLTVVNSEPVRPVPEQFREPQSRARKRYKKKAVNLWQRLLAGNEILTGSNGSFSIKSALSRDVSVICAEQFREEYYIPFAYLYDNRPVGGNYLHLWEAGVPEQLKQERAPICEKPVKEYFTGGCLFGTPLYGVDQFGNEHSLTNPYYDIPANSIIDEISCPYDIHPDEIMTRESLVNTVYMLKALGDNRPVLRYHLPFSNYILYGLNWFFKGRITSKALQLYILEVKSRVSAQINYLKGISRKFDIEIVPCSTLDVLEMDDFPEGSFVSCFLAKLGIDVEFSSILDKEQLGEISCKVHAGIINYMTSQAGAVGRVWRHINNKIVSSALEVDASDLLSLNYMDYSANLAVAACIHGDRETASVLPSHESPVTHWYKKVFAEEFGAVLCFQWLAPLQVHDELFRYRVFYLDEFIEDINELLKLGLIPKIFLQTAAVALDSILLAESSALQVKEIMSVHEQSIRLRARKEELMQKSSEFRFLYINDHVLAI